MKNPMLFFLLTLILGCLLMLSCDKEPFTDVETDANEREELILDELLDTETDLELGEVLYSNSFETKEELASIFEIRVRQGAIGLEQLNEYYFSHLAPKSGGQKSLTLQGTCVMPSIVMNVGPFKEDQNVVAKFWGQDWNGEDAFDGSLQFNIRDSVTDYEVWRMGDYEMEINNLEWKSFQTDVLHIPAGKILQIAPRADGGKQGGSTVYFDLLEVISVE